MRLADSIQLEESKFKETAQSRHRGTITLNDARYAGRQGRDHQAGGRMRHAGSGPVGVAATALSK